MQQINQNIELIGYRLFGDDLLLLELVDATWTSITDYEYPSYPKAISAAL